MTGKKLDTGTGGIRIPSKEGVDKIYTYDVGVEKDINAPADYGVWSGGDVNIDKSYRDLSKSTKRTLAQYLSETTLGKTNSVPDQADERSNRYSIDLNPDGTFNDFKTTEQGIPKGPQPVPKGAFEPLLGRDGFIPGQETGRSSLNSTVEAKKKWFSDQGISRGIIRDKSDRNSNKLDGNDLLKVTIDANKNIDPDHPVASYSSSLIKNRWTAENQFGSSPSIDTFKQRPLAAIKYNLGESYTPEQYNRPDITTVTQGQLAAVGNVLMARASAEIRATSDPLDPASISFETTSAQVPSPNQLGVYKVPELVMQAKDVLLSLDINGFIDTPGITDASINSIAPSIQNSLSLDAPLSSFGALNNPYDQYTGLGAIGMQTLAIAFVVAITLIPALVKPGSEGLKDAAKDSANEQDDYGRLPIGRYKTTSTSTANLTAQALLTGQVSFTDAIGFSPTVFPLSTCIDVGILTFYGIYNNNPSFLALADVAYLSGTEAYIVFSRAIFRSFMQLTEQIVKIGRAFANPTSGIQQVLNFIDFFRNSKLMRALNTFAQLGDQTLRDDVSSLDEKAKKGFGKKKSTVDTEIIKGDSAYRKFRLISPSSPTSSKALRHSWSSFRSPDMLMLPAGLQAASIADQELGAPRFNPLLEEDDSVGIRNGSTSNSSIKLKNGTYYPSSKALQDRISTEDRKHFEQILDAEYMPFYFHDVRTNEIVSFHAFLSSLGDSFTAAYDSTEAIGRVEPIKTYKSTTRKIDVSFQIAALSPEDFDYMWLKINKLTTLVYPQFTAGKLAETPNFKVTVPFSQQFAAPPLIRLRIGDLIQSNYSRFNLAKLFGHTYQKDEYYTDELGPRGAKGANVDLTKLPNEKEYKKLIVESFLPGNTFNCSNGLLDFTRYNYPALKSGRGLPQFLQLKIIKVSGEVAECVVEINDNQLQKLDKGVRDNLRNDLNKKYLPGKGTKPEQAILGRNCLVKLSDMTLTEQTLERAFRRKPELQTLAKYQAAVQEFMRPERNSVVRSFESSGGRGIPGFIESMSFDWYSGVVWSEDPSRGRAPKMCKVSISFSPFHDITPGLDATGANRAPIYPIGPLSPKIRK